VNRQPVVTLKVLHHGDAIEVGRAQLLLREMQIKRLVAGSTCWRAMRWSRAPTAESCTTAIAGSVAPCARPTVASTRSTRQ
jgi:hypothetical protein